MLSSIGDGLESEAAGSSKVLVASSVMLALLLNLVGTLGECSVGPEIPIRHNMYERLSAVTICEFSILDVCIKARECSVTLENNMLEEQILSMLMTGPQDIGALCITRKTSKGPPMSPFTSIHIYMMRLMMNFPGSSHS